MITFNNKTTLVDQPSVAEENKVTAGNMNEIKSVYNTEIGDVSNLITSATNVVDAINESVVKLSNLWNGSKSTSGSVSLSDAYTNYDLIAFTIGANSTNNRKTEFIWVKDIIQTNGELNFSIFQSVTVYMTMSGYFASGTSFNISKFTRETWNTGYLISIHGIKF